MENNILPQKFAEKLIPLDPKKPKWYFLPKIHKSLINPPGRPIVAGCGSMTEYLSQFLDWFLRPLLDSVPSYLKDTTMLLKELEKIQFSENWRLTSIDIVNLYSRIRHVDGIAAVRRLLERSNKDEKSINFICECLEFVLMHNAFCYGEQWYIQKTGVAMGTPVAPTLANLFLAIWEEEFIYSVNNPHISSIKYWGRYLDDTLILWDGPREEFFDFVEYLNHNSVNMQFTAEWGGNQINFLDVSISNNEGSLKTCGYRKKTATNSLLHFNSYHPYHVKRAVSYGQFIRLRRINTDYNDFIFQAQDLMDRLRIRGYPEDIISVAFQKAAKIDRKALIYKSRNKKTNDRFVFSFQYSPMSEKIKNAIYSNWHILSQDVDLKDSVCKPPIISFRKCKNLRNELVSSQYSDKRDTWLSSMSTPGNHKCGSCSYCAQLVSGKSIEMGGNYIPIHDFITCRSKFVTYVIFCPCRRFYIGKTNRNLFTRFREHMRSIVTGKGSPRLIEHMRQHHNSDAKVLKFAGIQKIAHDVSNKHKILLQMENRLILKYNALGPLGLNDRIEYSMFL